MSLLRSIRLISLLIPAAGIGAAGTLPAEVFTFTGTCSDCTGIGSGTLTVAGTYQLGAAFANTDFISFTYSSNVLDVEMDAHGTGVNSFSSLFGSLPVGLGAADVSISGYFDFQSQTINNNAWDIGIDDFGTNGVWSQAASNTPEPASWGLVLLGIAGVAAIYPRASRRRSHAWAKRKS